MVTAIIACAGSGVRTGFNENKLFKKINGKTIIEKTYGVFKNCKLINEIILTVSIKDQTYIKELIPDAKIVIGGSTRTQSVRNGLDAATGDIVLVHDGARPFVTKEIILDAIESVKKYGSGIASYPTADTLAAADDGFITKNLGKTGKFVIQTPQAFYLKDILKAYSLGDEDCPDESSLYLKYIGKPHLSKGSPSNKKLTYAEDFTTNKVGNGYDTHELVADRKLILGGIEIPHDKGLLGHSDADVLTHAIMDALLSAAGLRDIGYYFPDTDEKYKGISSVILLEKVMYLLKENGYKVINVTACVLAQKPKLAPYIEKIRDNLSKIIGVNKNDFGLTATTTEGLGFIGREEGIAVYATCLLSNI